MEKRLGNHHAAAGVFSDLASCRNAFRGAALEELAKHYEHREKNYGMALEFTRAARQAADTPRLRLREERLRKRATGPRNGRLL
jgi:hypothetical protein